ncbi:hypothetical protein B0T17DRAFT_128471 [Bombardia bombarda]|uniref:Uncharacterized protein n=1 Tax=Bombardia bombarda TaxID=252184 RepID=A0AA39T0W4_9PEZI|nr:hypothetical protein B0T17DRAFT_128471 [Bombardia bombarda]
MLCHSGKERQSTKNMEESRTHQEHPSHNPTLSNTRQPPPASTKLLLNTPYRPISSRPMANHWPPCPVKTKTSRGSAISAWSTIAVMFTYTYRGSSLGRQHTSTMGLKVSC